MTATLDYASASRRDGRRRWPLAAASTLIAVGSAAASVTFSYHGATTLISTMSGCATGRGAAMDRLFVIAPVTCALACVAWRGSVRAGVGVALCRFAFVSAGAAWLGSAAVFFV